MNYAPEKYRNEIDGLRAFSVLAVVLFHAFPNIFSGGFVGVDIFFVISGYLITGIILKADVNKSFVLEFYSRRVCRLFPSLIFVLAFCLVFGCLFLFAEELAALSKHIIGGAFFISNFVSWSEVGYFDKNSNLKPLLHLWSLGVEEQFYITIPFLLLLIPKNKIWIVFLIIFSTSLTLNLYFSYFNVNLSSAYYLPFTRFWEIAAGAMISIFEKSGKFKLRFNMFFYILCVALILLSFSLIDQSTPYPGFMALPLVISTMGLLTINKDCFLIHSFLSNKFFVYIGRISYPLYLWHFVLLAFLRVINGIEIPTHVILITLGISFLLSIFCYEIIEKPFRGRLNRKLTALFLILALFTLSAAAYFVNFSAKHFPEQVNPPEITAFNARNIEIRSNADCLRNFAPSSASEFLWYFCRSNSNTPETIILGDSYANALFEGFLGIEQIGNAGIVHTGACDPATTNPASTDYSRIGKSHPCAGNNFLQSIKKIREVIMTPNVKKIIYVISDPAHVLLSNDYEKIFLTVEFLNQTIFKGKEISIILPHQHLNHDPTLCFDRRLKLQPINRCVNVKKNMDFDLVYEAFKNVSIENNLEAFIYNPNELFCSNTTCNFVRDGEPLFRDAAGHLNFRGSTIVAKGFDAKLTKHNQ